MAKEFALSKEQAAAAKSFGTELGVSAGAGSGKTTVLVERYLEAIVKKGAWPEEILAVTFTDKAANVMKERLRKRCAERGLYEVARRLDGAWIGTIHSFCSRFLKENPVECGVDPLFTQLGRGEQEVLMEEVMDRLFEEEVSSGLCMDLLADAGEEAVREALKSFYDKQRSYAGGQDLLHIDDAAVHCAEAETTLKERCKKELASPAVQNEHEEKLRAALGCLLEVLDGKAKGWERRRALLGAVAALNKRSPKTKERVGEFKDLADALATLYVQILAVPMKEEWCRLIQRFAEAYEKEKRRLGTHDFDDLLYFTYRALSGTTPQLKALRRRVRERFTHIFVDEYQDTSILQDRIIGLLKRPDNLFMVGDVRQSIYRFRHAHPEIFLGALERVRSYELRENYRSRPELLELVNRVFCERFGEKYAPLVPKRSFKLKKEHCVEWIGVPKDERRLDPLRVIEARTIAARIRKMVDSGFEVEDGGERRPARWRDFAILMRKTTASRLYEKELEAFSIPYFVNKGRGFYEQIEVADLVHFLRALDDSSENLATAAVLRSPLVQLSDDALFWLSKKRLAARPEGSLGAALLAFEEVPELSETDRGKIKTFLGWYQRLRGQKDRLRVSELLHAIVDETAYEAKLLTKPDGRQASANVWKLIEMASAVEEGNIRSISDFIRYLKSVSDSSETEAEARVLGEEEDVLRILTVHAAKGLEFPIVVLADLGAEDGNSRKPAFLCSPSSGLGARLKDPTDYQDCQDAAYTAIAAEEKQKEAEEEDRLLYVAMTRAKEHLIFSGVGEGEPMKSLKQDLEASKTPCYQVPVVTIRPVASVSGFRRLIEEMPKKLDSHLIEEIRHQLADVEKEYELMEDMSVSRLTSFVDYRTGSEISLPDPVRSAEAKETPEEEDGSTPRNEFGTLFHYLMELSVRNSPRGKLEGGRLESLTKELTIEEKSEAEDGLKNFWKGPLGQAVKKASKCYPELPFIYKTRHGMLRGQIDLVFRDRDGWAIVDYKTNRFFGPTAEKTAIETYTPQLGLYALAFWKLYGEIPYKTLLYFLSGDKTVEIRWSEKELAALALQLESWYRKALAF